MRNVTHPATKPQNGLEPKGAITEPQVRRKPKKRSANDNTKVRLLTHGQHRPPPTLRPHKLRKRALHTPTGRASGASHAHTHAKTPAHTHTRHHHTHEIRPDQTDHTRKKHQTHRRHTRHARHTADTQQTQQTHRTQHGGGEACWRLSAKISTKLLRSSK